MQKRQFYLGINKIFANFTYGLLKFAMVYRKASLINTITFVNLRFEIEEYEK